MSTVELFCVAGNHTWERESQRGRRPRNCPKHADMASTEPIDVKAATASASDKQLRQVEIIREAFNWSRRYMNLAAQKDRGEITSEQFKDMLPPTPKASIPTSSMIEGVRHLMPELQQKSSDA